MKARVDWRVRSAPQPPGAGVGLLGFCVWIFAVLLWACWVVAKWSVVAVIALVAMIAETGRGQHRAPRAKPVAPEAAEPSPFPHSRAPEAQQWLTE